MIGQSSFVQLLKMLKAFRLMRLMKLLRIAKLSTLLSRYQDHVFLFTPVLTIAKQLVLLIFLGHVAGCFFFFFSDTTWQTRVERQMIAADDMTTWTLSEMFSQDLFVTAEPQEIALQKRPPWTRAHTADGELANSDSSNAKLFCPQWYTAYLERGTWICRSSQGFISRCAGSCCAMCIV